MKFITDHPADFKDDIFTMTKMSVEEYVEHMTPHFRFGDQIMVIALCLSFEVSITLYQKGRLQSFIDVCIFAPRSGSHKNHAEIFLDLYGYHYDCLLEQVPLHQVSNLFQDLSATSNAGSSVEMLNEKEYSEMLCDDPAVALSAVVDEELNYFEETFDFEENSNPNLTASSSSIPSVPPAKKFKVDLPYTEKYEGKIYKLSEYGLNNFKKLVANKQMDINKQLVVGEKNCKECQEAIDWRTDGPISKTKGVFYYAGRHNGKCVKKGQDGPALAFDKELKEIDSKLIGLTDKKDKTKADLKLIAELTARIVILFQKGINSKSAPIKKKAGDDAELPECAQELKTTAALSKPKHLLSTLDRKSTVLIVKRKSLPMLTKS